MEVTDTAGVAVLADPEGCSYQLVFGADYNIKGGDGKGPGRGKRGL